MKAQNTETSSLKRGDEVTYSVTLAFDKGTEKRTATVVAINGYRILLDDGTTFYKVN